MKGEGTTGDRSGAAYAERSWQLAGTLAAKDLGGGPDRSAQQEGATGQMLMAIDLSESYIQLN
jgi:hypothetical protein